MPILEKDAFKIKGGNVKKRISNKTKLLILNIPNNPQGVILEKEDLGAIPKISIKNNLIVISDGACELSFMIIKNIIILLIFQE